LRHLLLFDPSDIGQRPFFKINRVTFTLFFVFHWTHSPGLYFKELTKVCLRNYTRINYLGEINMFKLKAVELKNFRSFQEKTRITIDNITTFIGKNDAGKSTVLEALEIFFNNDIVKIEQGD